MNKKINKILCIFSFFFLLLLVVACDNKSSSLKIEQIKDADILWGDVNYNFLDTIEVKYGTKKLNFDDYTNFAIDTQAIDFYKIGNYKATVYITYLNKEYDKQINVNILANEELEYIFNYEDNAMIQLGTAFDFKSLFSLSIGGLPIEIKDSMLNTTAVNLGEEGEYEIVFTYDRMPSGEILTQVVVVNVIDGNVEIDAILKTIRVGESIDYRSMFVVNVDGISQTISSNMIDASEVILLKAGTYEVHLSITIGEKIYNKTSSLIIEEPVIEITPTSKHIKIGATMDYRTMFSIKLNGSTVGVTNAMINSSAVNLMLEGSYDVILTYQIGEYSASATAVLTISDSIVEIIAIDKMVKVGDAVDFTTLFTLKVDNIVKAVTLSMIDASEVNLLKVGVYEVYFSYSIADRLFSDSATLTVGEPTLELTPIAKSIKLGETIDYKTMFSLKLNGKTVTILDSMLDYSDVELLKIGTYDVILAYQIGEYSISETAVLTIVEQVVELVANDITSAIGIAIDYTTLFTLTVNGVNIPITLAMIDASAVNINVAGDYEVVLTYVFLDEYTYNKTAIVTISSDPSVGLSSAYAYGFSNYSYTMSTNLVITGLLDSTTVYQTEFDNNKISSVVTDYGVTTQYFLRYLPSSYSYDLFTLSGGVWSISETTKSLSEINTFVERYGFIDLTYFMASDFTYDEENDVFILSQSLGMAYVGYAFGYYDLGSGTYSLEIKVKNSRIIHLEATFTTASDYGDLLISFTIDFSKYGTTSVELPDVSRPVYEYIENDSFENAFELELDVENKFEIFYAKEVGYYYFIPTEGAIYNIEAAAGKDSYVTLYDSNHNILASNDNINYSQTYFSLTYQLEMGEKYYFAVKFKSDYQKGDFNFKLTYVSEIPKEGSSFEYAIQLELNQLYQNNIAVQKDYYYYFIPEVKGTYIFYSNGVLDIAGFMYNADKTQIASNDDSGEGKNFSITILLEAGEKYYFFAKLYTIAEVGEYSISLEMEQIYLDLSDFVGTYILSTNTSQTLKIYSSTKLVWNNNTYYIDSRSGNVIIFDIYSATLAGTVLTITEGGNTYIFNKVALGNGTSFSQAYEIDLDLAYTINITTNGNSYYTKYIPEVSGYYIFTVFGNDDLKTLQFYNNAQQSLKLIEYESSIRLVYYLEANQTYYFRTRLTIGFYTGNFKIQLSYYPEGVVEAARTELNTALKKDFSNVTINITDTAGLNIQMYYDYQFIYIVDGLNQNYFFYDNGKYFAYQPNFSWLEIDNYRQSYLHFILSLIDVQRVNYDNGTFIITGEYASLLQEELFTFFSEEITKIIILYENKQVVGFELYGLTKQCEILFNDLKQTFLPFDAPIVGPEGIDLVVRKSSGTSFETANAMRIDLLYNIENKDNGIKNYFIFVPQETGIYRFTSIDGRNGNDPKAYIYNENGQLLKEHGDVATWDRNFLIEMDFIKGDIYYFMIEFWNKSDLSTPFNCNITITCLSVYPEPTKLDTPLNLIIVAEHGEYKASFTKVDNAQSYILYAQVEEEVFVIPVVQYGLIAFPKSGSYSIQIQALGDRIIYANSDLSATIAAQVAILTPINGGGSTILAATTMILNQPYTVRITDEMKTAYFIFVPAEAGIYTFQSVNSEKTTKADLYNSSQSKISSAEGSLFDNKDFTLTASLTAGLPYYISTTVETGLGTQGYGTYNIRVIKIA